MTADQIISAAKARRNAAGLFLEAACPERRGGTFTCYPKNAAELAKWKARLVADGCFILREGTGNE